MRKLIFTLLFCTPFLSWAQPKALLEEVMVEILNHEPLEKYFYDREGLPKDIVIQANEIIPADIEVEKFGKTLPVMVRTPEGKKIKNILEITRFQSRHDKIKISLRFNHRVFLKLTMLHLNGDWVVSKSILMHERPGASGRGKKDWVFSW